LIFGTACKDFYVLFTFPTYCTFPLHVLYPIQTLNAVCTPCRSTEFHEGVYYFLNTKVFGGKRLNVILFRPVGRVGRSERPFTWSPQTLNTVMFSSVMLNPTEGRQYTWEIRGEIHFPPTTPPQPHQKAWLSHRQFPLSRYQINNFYGQFLYTLVRKVYEIYIKFEEFFTSSSSSSSSSCS